MITITLLGTGGPIPDPHRAGPATLVSAGSERYLVDAGRGVLMRLAAASSGAAQLSAVLLTHLHSDHMTDLNDVITTRWITTLEPAPLKIQRVLDTLDYHSSPEEAAQTAARTGIGTLVLTHYFPPPAAGDGDEYVALAAEHFDGTIEVGHDLHPVEIGLWAARL